MLSYIYKTRLIDYYGWSPIACTGKIRATRDKSCHHNIRPGLKPSKSALHGMSSNSRVSFVASSRPRLSPHDPGNCRWRSQPSSALRSFSTHVLFPGTRQIEIYHDHICIRDNRCRHEMVGYVWVDQHNPPRKAQPALMSLQLLQLRVIRDIEECGLFSRHAICTIISLIIDS